MGLPPGVPGLEGRGRRRIMSSLSAFVPILALFALAAAFALGSVGVSQLVGPKRANRAKLEAYECGIEPSPEPIHGGRFPVRFFLTAMLFIVFDIEIVFLYPLAVVLHQLAWFGFVELLFFVVILALAYVYIWRKGALEWR